MRENLETLKTNLWALREQLNSSPRLSVDLRAQTHKRLGEMYLELEQLGELLAQFGL